MSEKGWEIVEMWESDIGVYVTVNADYDLQTTVNFNKSGMSPEALEARIERSFDRWYRRNKPEEGAPVVKPGLNEVSGKFKKLKTGFKKSKD